MSEKKGNILVVDDQESVGDLLKTILTKEGHHVETTTEYSEALDTFDEENFDVVLQDIEMSDESGLNLIKRYRDGGSPTQVIVITAYSTWERSVEAMREGAFDYFTKPFDNDEIRAGVNRAIRASRRERDRTPETETEISQQLIGDSTPIKKVRKTIQQVAPTDVTVLILGESGTGKELVARAIHQNSPRKDAQFMCVNCGAFPENLLESELFGHQKGAFTGAHQDKEGIIKVADRGTLFLDEIGEMPPQMQVKLLRVLENQDIKPVGGTERISVDVRFLAASNQDLEEMVESGQFREDLYYRLNVVQVELPPLRERGEDIFLLAGHFLNEATASIDKEIEGFTEEARNLMQSYHWPGNVRELENAIQQAVTLAEEPEITPELLLNNRSTRDKSENISIPSGGMDLEEHLENLEKQYIRKALDRTGNNITEAAKLLGYTFRSLRYKIDKFDIETD